MAEEKKKKTAKAILKLHKGQITSENGEFDIQIHITTLDEKQQRCNVSVEIFDGSKLLLGVVNTENGKGSLNFKTPANKAGQEIEIIGEADIGGKHFSEELLVKLPKTTLKLDKGQMRIDGNAFVISVRVNIIDEDQQGRDANVEVFDEHKKLQNTVTINNGKGSFDFKIPVDKAGQEIKIICEANIDGQFCQDEIILTVPYATDPRSGIRNVMANWKKFSWHTGITLILFLALHAILYWAAGEQRFTAVIGLSLGIIGCLRLFKLSLIRGGLAIAVLIGIPWFCAKHPALFTNILWNAALCTLIFGELNYWAEEALPRTEEGKAKWNIYPWYLLIFLAFLVFYHMVGFAGDLLGPFFTDTPKTDLSTIEVFEMAPEHLDEFEMYEEPKGAEKLQAFLNWIPGLRNINITGALDHLHNALFYMIFALLHALRGAPGDAIAWWKGRGKSKSGTGDKVESATWGLMIYDFFREAKDYLVRIFSGKKRST